MDACRWHLCRCKNGGSAPPAGGSQETLHQACAQTKGGIAFILAARDSALDAVDGSSTRHVSATDVGAVKAPTIQRSYPCRQSRQSVSTSPSRSFRSMASMRPAKWLFAGS